MIVPLVAANWLIPPGFPLLLRQIVLCAWGVGAIFVCERLLFSATARDAFRAMGFVRARGPAVLVALLVSVPMWIFLPVYAGLHGVPIALQPEWPALLAGVIRHHAPRRDGTVRDTVIYSILAAEWPDVRRHLELRLARNPRKPNTP